MTILEASATGSDTTTNTSYELMDSMTLTPGAGDFIAVFSGSVELNTADLYIYVAIAVNGTEIAHTEREFYNESSLNPSANIIATHAHISPGAAQDVEVYWKVSGSSTATVYERTLNLFPVDSANVDQVTATGDDTLSSNSYTQLGSMTITPGAGDYLLLFSASAQGPGDTGTDILFAVHVNGTIVPAY